MITRFDLDERVREWGLREEVVEKDYVLGWLLWGIGSDATLSEHWAFKGGTCLKKCFIETYRFSEDLDFTVLPGGPIKAEDVSPMLQDILVRVNASSGIDFSERTLRLKTHTSGLYTEGRVYYKGPRGSPMVASVKLDLSGSEKVVRPTVRRFIAHGFPDELPEPRTVQCYSFEEVFAEKIRAMGERGRPRDLYDIINLYRRDDLRSAPAIIREVLVDKCQTKGIPVPSYAAIAASTTLAELEAEWENMLAHQLPALPPLRDFWAELAALFEWLEGRAVRPELATVAAVTSEPEDVTWAPPPTVSVWGTRAPMEAIRFAAANRLCIELGYQGSRRTVEPYSLRRTQAGNLLLHAVKADTREPRSYRVERIESVSVTSRTFVPVYQIEFSLGGPLNAPPTPGKSYSISTPRSSRRGTGVVYIIECHFCHRHFQRSIQDFALGVHKTPDGYRCPGSSSRGFLVDTQYG